MQKLLVATLASLALLSACGSAIDDEAASAGGDDLMTYEAELIAPVDQNRILTDAEALGGQNITSAQVQAFLEMNGSFLAGYKDPAWSNKSAATLIVERGQASGVHPLYLLTRIQIESGLIQSGTSHNLDQATGCGCPDSGGCSRSYVGFGNQVDCAAKKLKGYLATLDATGQTLTGWKVGVTKSSSDPCHVTPANRVTAALYTYTPWVGAYGKQGCGRNDVGGSTLVGVVYDRYQTLQDWGDTTSPASCLSDTVGHRVRDAVCVQSAGDGVLRQCGDGAWKTHAEDGRTCLRSFIYCHSSTLGTDVPTRTCVQEIGRAHV